jgi:hypothetical protein
MFRPAYPSRLTGPDGGTGKECQVEHWAVGHRGSCLDLAREAWYNRVVGSTRSAEVGAFLGLSSARF